MVDHEILSKCLKKIIESYDSKSARESIETMFKMHRNILENEDDVTFRKIKLGNPAFAKKVWSLYPARQFLLMSGWIVLEIDELIVFNHDERLLDIIELLVNHRDIAPKTPEWISETKHEGKSESQLREEFLRRKAIAEREKELKEFMKDKKYREDLAVSLMCELDLNDSSEDYESPMHEDYDIFSTKSCCWKTITSYYNHRLTLIKKQIESDKAKRKQIFTRPVIGNKLVKGAKIRTLNSPQSPRQR